MAGSPGIGKTALVKELLGVAAADAAIGVGQCVELRGAGEAYLPVLGAVRQLCEAKHGPTFVDRLVEVAPSWVLQLPGLVPPDGIDSLRARYRGRSRRPHAA